jgi:hypothetical protein
MMVPVSMGFFGGHVEGAATESGRLCGMMAVALPGMAIARFTWFDGSTWPAYCNRAESQEHPITYLVHAKRCGRMVRMTACMGEIPGQYLYWISAGRLVVPDCTW